MELHLDPEAGMEKMESYPSDEFLKHAERHYIARYANFLLQSIMMLTRVYQAPKKLAETFGCGVGSSARLALLMMRSFTVEGHAATRLKSVTRHLYARMLQEGEGSAQIDQTVAGEWKEDRASALSDRLDEFLELHVGPGIMEGLYPKTNLKEDHNRQWDDYWKVASHTSDTEKC